MPPVGGRRSATQAAGHPGNAGRCARRGGGDGVAAGWRRGGEGWRGVAVLPCAAVGGVATGPRATVCGVATGVTRDGVRRGDGGHVRRCAAWRRGSRATVCGVATGVTCDGVRRGCDPPLAEPRSGLPVVGIEAPGCQQRTTKRRLNAPRPMNTSGADAAYVWLNGPVGASSVARSGHPGASIPTMGSPLRGSASGGSQPRRRVARRRVARRRVAHRRVAAAHHARVPAV